MIFKIAIVISSALLSGCAQKLWFGQNPQKDLYECRMEAARTYSPAMYNTTIGTGYRTPSYTTCNAYGYSASCTTTGGNYVPPAQLTMDANASNRENHFSYCMISRGNQLMTQKQYDNSRKIQPQKKKTTFEEACLDWFDASYVKDACREYRRENGYD